MYNTNKCRTFAENLQCMTREDFSKALRQFRDKNNVPLKDIVFALQTFEGSIYRIEKAKYNYSVQSAINYTNSVNAQIVVITPEGKEYAITDATIATKLLIKLRGDTSIYRIAKDTGYSTTGITSAETKLTSLTIDMFLKLCEYYNLTVEIRSK